MLRSIEAGSMAGCDFRRNNIVIACWAFPIKLKACLKTEGTAPHLEQSWQHPVKSLKTHSPSIQHLVVELACSGES